MARHPPATRYAKSSGAQIAYQVSGTGPPDLVMVPGLVSHLDIQWQQPAYRRFVRALEQGCRVIRLGQDHLPWVGDWQAVVGEVLAFAGQVAPARSEPRPRRRGIADAAPAR